MCTSNNVNHCSNRQSSTSRDGAAKSNTVFLSLPMMCAKLKEGAHVDYRFSGALQPHTISIYQRLMHQSSIKAKRVGTFPVAATQHYKAVRVVERANVPPRGMLHTGATSVSSSAHLPHSHLSMTVLPGH